MTHWADVLWRLTVVGMLICIFIQGQRPKVHVTTSGSVINATCSAAR